MLYSSTAIKCFCNLRHNQWNYRNVHLVGKNEVITIKEKSHLLIILYKCSMKGKAVIPIVAQQICAGAQHWAPGLGSEAARPSRWVSQAFLAALGQERHFKEVLKIRRGLSFNRIGISRCLLTSCTLCICQLCLKTSDSEFGVEHTELLSHCFVSNKSGCSTRSGKMGRERSFSTYSLC